MKISVSFLLAWAVLAGCASTSQKIASRDSQSSRTPAQLGDPNDYTNHCTALGGAGDPCKCNGEIVTNVWFPTDEEKSNCSGGASQPKDPTPHTDKSPPLNKCVFTGLSARSSSPTDMTPSFQINCSGEGKDSSGKACEQQWVAMMNARSLNSSMEAPVVRVKAQDDSRTSIPIPDSKISSLKSDLQSDLYKLGIDEESCDPVAQVLIDSSTPDLKASKTCYLMFDLSSSVWDRFQNITPACGD